MIKQFEGMQREEGSAPPLMVGIDPDIDKSGVACFYPKTKQLELAALTFFQLFDYLKTDKENIKEVVVEAGWLNTKSNWHSKGLGEGIAANIGKKTGSNHETGRKIIEMCEYLGIPCRALKPLKKMWKGREGKITHEEFRKITGIMGRTNQETRDAALLVWK